MRTNRGSDTSDEKSPFKQHVIFLRKAQNTLGVEELRKPPELSLIYFGLASEIQKISLLTLQE